MTNTFPSEDMARNATRVWQLAKSIKVAIISPRHLQAGDAGAGTPDISDGKTHSPAADTARTPGPLATRPVRARFQDDSNFIWFIVPRRSALAEPAKDNAAQAMQVTFSNGGEGDHIVFEGVARMVDGKDMLQKLWDSHADIHFPQGPEDPGVALMRFEPSTAHFWTGGQDFISFAVHYITAKMTGEPQKVGKHGMVMPI